jgi:transposase
MELLAAGKTKEAIAAEVGIGVSSVYRIVAEHRVVTG